MSNGLHDSRLSSPWSHRRALRRPPANRTFEMPPDNRRLTRHLAIAVIAKIAVLTGLWFTFFHQPGVSTGPLHASEDTAAHVLGAARQGATP